MATFVLQTNTAVPWSDGFVPCSSVPGAENTLESFPTEYEDRLTGEVKEGHASICLHHDDFNGKRFLGREMVAIEVEDLTDANYFRKGNSMRLRNCKVLAVGSDAKRFAVPRQAPPF